MTYRKKIGLIIGSGELATWCLKRLFLLGYEVTIARLPCSTVKIKKNTNYIDIEYEKINEAFSYLKSNKINNIALIGYMERPEIDATKVTHDSQKILLHVFSALKKGDGLIFKAVKEMFVNQKFNLVKIQELLPELVLSTGTYGFSISEKDMMNEIQAGIKVFLNYAKLDFGQSLIFQEGHCLGIESITGTDEMIRTLINYRKKNKRKLKKPSVGGILIKGSKPDQILDIDTPVVGPITIELAKKANLKGLVIESDKVIVVNKDIVIKLLNNYNMFLFATNF